MVGAGVVLIVIAMLVLLLQIPFAVVNETVPAGPDPQTTFTVCALVAPLIVPPDTVQAYVDAAGAL